MVRIVFCLLGLLLSQNSFALSQVTATVDKNPVQINESFMLEVTADDDVNTNALDTSPLLKKFIVGGTSVSSQTSMINFKTTRSTVWHVMLIAKQAGEITIPALTVNGKQTAPIALVVSKSNNNNAARAQQDVFISTEVSQHTVYVQQQFTLTVKLHFATELKRGSLTDPVLKGATMTQVGKDQESSQIINGRRFRVITRTYTVNPEQSGNLTLSPPVFSGEIMINNSPQSMFLNFADTKPVSATADDINITVKPIPDNYQGTWLPSELLTLHDEWQPKKAQFKVGEPITRTITLAAAGLSTDQLPKISMALPAGLKVYPDQAKHHSRINQGQMVSQEVQNFAIVASKPGTYTIPALTIPWWNTVTNRSQIATIPASTITVLPSDNANNKNDTSKSSNSPTLQTNNTAPTQIIVQQSSTLQWLFLGLWLLTSFAWLMTYLINKPKPIKSTSIKSTVQDNRSLISACKQNNGEQVLNLLLPWANNLAISDHPINTLDELTAHIAEPTFTAAIADLQQCYFAKNAKLWQGSTLLNCIIEIQKNSAKPTEQRGFQLNP